MTGSDSRCSTVKSLYYMQLIITIVLCILLLAPTEKLQIIYFYILCGRIKGFNNAVYAIKCQEVVIELWLGSYRTIELTLFKRKPFICEIPLFNTIKELCFIHTSVGVKYNKTLKVLLLRLYEIYSSW